MPKTRRWYDQDPILSEAMELLRISTEDLKGSASEHMERLQEQIAHEVIERVYQSVQKYSDEGVRWYDKDPVMLKAIELLRAAPPQVQKRAAKKLLESLQEKDNEDDADNNDDYNDDDELNE